MLDYSIVVPAYNEEKLLPATLRTLRQAMNGASSERQGEIIVVDNNSTDTTADIARQAGVRVVFEPINRISRARNAGAREPADATSSSWTRTPMSRLPYSQAPSMPFFTKMSEPAALLQFDEDGPIGFSTSASPNSGIASLATYVWPPAVTSSLAETLSKPSAASRKVAGENSSFQPQRWCRRNRKTFRILTEPPVLTSAEN